MGNTCSHSASPFSHAYPPRTYQVFISHRGEDTKQNIASHVYHNLRRRGYSVFLDKYSIRGGEAIMDSIKHAIRSASVHVVIFSPRFADSEWCLDELIWMLESRAPIVPVFCGVEPSEVRMEDEDAGAYVRAFQMHKQTGKFDTHTLKKWEEALRDVSDRKGFTYNGDQGKKLEKIAGCVARLIKIMRIAAKASQRISWRKLLGVSSNSLKKKRIAAKALPRADKMRNVLDVIPCKGRCSELGAMV